jgi:hypothetical protein
MLEYRKNVRILKWYWNIEKCENIKKLYCVNYAKEVRVLREQNAACWDV